MMPCDPQLVALVIVAFLVAFLLAFSIGANDVANSFGTSVGSKVLTITQACVLATIFEMLGAVLIGYKVSDTMRKGILDVSVYEGDEKLLIMGSLASLIASAIWLLVATALKLPISGTHSIVGATIGYSFVLKGSAGINWKEIGKIVLSWIMSPLLSGVISSTLFYIIKLTIINAKNPMASALRALPIAYGATIAINALSVLLDGPELLKLDLLPWWGSLISAIGFGTVAAVLVTLFVVPWQRKKLLSDPELDIQINEFTNNKDLAYVEAANGNEKDATATKLPHVAVQNETNLNTVDKTVTVSSTTIESGISLSKNNSSTTLGEGDKDDNKTDNKDLDKDNIKSCQEECKATGKDKTEDGKSSSLNEHPAVAKLFSFLQILTATFGSFAHGGNDVSNAIGPLIGIWMVFVEHSVYQTSQTPFPILFYGGLGISVGLWCLGHRVIETLGNDLVEITPTSGFSIEVASAATVLMASKIGIPVSTTHCKVGSVICVGWASNGKNHVSWHTFRNIAFAWIFTVPASGLISAACIWIMQKILL